MKSSKISLALAAAALVTAAASTPASALQGTGKGDPSGLNFVELRNDSTPLVAIRLQLNVGSIHDPAGKEGLAALTGQMIGASATQKRSYPELLDALYPMATTIDSNVDREVTVFFGAVHRDNLEAYTQLLEEALLTPGFKQDDFERNRDQLLATLTNNLRSNDELLGLEMLQQAIYKGHPYGHSPAGTVESLKNITLDDVKKFYQEHYTRSNLTIGLAGGYPASYPAALGQQLAKMPLGTKRLAVLPDAPKVEGRKYTLIDKETASVGIHLGFPVPFTRADADYYPMMVVNSALGEHRTFNGRLMNELRGVRGLNYGDYSYIEYWFLPPFTDKPEPHVPRREQYFSVWIRPVVPGDAQFALRAALYEVQRMKEKGLTQQEFELTRSFLINYSKLWAQSLGTRLGYAMDSRYYGMPYYIDEIEKRLNALTLEQVNAAAKKYLSTDNYTAVLVTAGAEGLKQTLMKDEPSPKTYDSKVDDAVLATDKSIVPLAVKPTSIDILPIAQAFQK